MITSQEIINFTMHDDLTDAESRMLFTIKVIEHQHTYGTLPRMWNTTAKDIAHRRDMSYTGVLRILNSLETKGYVNKTKLPGTKEKLWKTV